MPPPIEKCEKIKNGKKERKGRKEREKKKKGEKRGEKEDERKGKIRNCYIYRPIYIHIYINMLCFLG